jgi:hypothetical protein
MSWENYDRLLIEITDLRRTIALKEQEFEAARKHLSGVSLANDGSKNGAVGTTGVDDTAGTASDRPPRFVLETAVMVRNAGKPVTASDVATHFRIKKPDAAARLSRACSQYQLITRVRRGHYAAGGQQGKHS